MDFPNQDKSKFLLSKVPEVTIFFWVIKVLCTTTGETFSDFLNVNVRLGLILTTLIMGTAFIAAMYLQFRTTQYVPGVYC